MNADSICHICKKIIPRAEFEEDHLPVSVDDDEFAHYKCFEKAMQPRSHNGEAVYQYTNWTPNRSYDQFIYRVFWQRSYGRLIGYE